MTLKVLDGRLSATFNIDGKHYQRYLNRRAAVVSALCDQLLLHDEIFVPTQDYFTAAALVRILGADNLIALLEEERIRFIRLRGFFGYVRGTAPEGRLVAMNSPGKLVTAPLDQAIEKSLAAVQQQKNDHRRLIDLLLARSTQLELATVVDAIHRDAYADLSQASLWKDDYRLSNPDLIALPGVEEMGVRVLGPSSDISNNVVDACLALGLMNIELYLAKEFQCDSVSTGSPIGDCISLKLPRLLGEGGNSIDPQRLWSFLEVAGVPDISGALASDPTRLKDYMKLTRGRDAVAFRNWFHGKADLSEKELVKAYIEVLRETPWIQTGGGKVLRMIASLGLGAFGLGLAVDAAASTIDSFVVDEYVRGRGAKFFVERLAKFSGRLRLRSLPDHGE